MEGFLRATLIYSVMLVTCERKAFTVYTICIARSKVRVRGRSLAGIVGSNPTGGMAVCLL